MVKGSGTRSGLLWEVERLLDECEELPQVLLMENVPQVIGKKNIKDFQSWRSKLESLGYSNYVQLLNAKDYGIPQNRNRCFMVSILGNYHYTFPKKKKLKLKLKDMLEDQVDEKYYLSDEMVEFFTANSKKQKELGNGFRFDPFERESSTLTHNKSDEDGQRVCKRELCSEIEVCDIRYDEGLRSRVEKHIMPTISASCDHGVSGRPLVKVNENGTI